MPTTVRSAYDGLTFTSPDTLVVEQCFKCHMLFAMPQDLRRRALDDHTIWFYCPAGHGQHYIGKSTEQKLQEEQARARHLEDQLQASRDDAEHARRTILRERERFANGVCPCCNRSFENVRRHMETKHPEYDVKRIEQKVQFRCSCGHKSPTYRGLRVHQGQLRREKWRTHETVV